MLKNLKSLGQTKVMAILSLLILALVVLGCNSKPEMPNDAAVQTVVKSTVSDFADAVDKGDFKAFREKASQDFQSQFTEDKLKSSFQAFVDKKDIVVPILKSTSGMTPKFSTPPAMREENGNYILVTKGTFDTEPATIRFDNEYVWRDSAWKLLKVGMYAE